MKKLLLLSLSLLAFSSVQAKQIDTSTVINNARRFCANTIDKQQGVEKVLDLVYTESTNGADNFYIFNVGKNDGFVIMSADDCAESVLGYSDEGYFDPNNIPANMKYMLDEYKREINYAIEHNLTTTTSATSDTKTAIEPIIKTKWNQGTPYNDLCPEYKTGYKSASGCTATAMAQVMKFHNWPNQGNGSKTYTAEKINTELTVNFGDATYDWAHMTKTYSDASTAEENSAVATLMYHCGVGANMNYGESSGASFGNAYKALINYFRYDKSTKYTHRRYYSVSEWNDLIYNELKNNRPVLYAGYNESAGHAYVCDGYSKDNYFHINWGWGGMADGYFRLSALDPSSQGIGGSSSGYNYRQEIIYNICKEKGTEQNTFAAGVTNGFKVNQSSVSTTSSSTIDFSWMNNEDNNQHFTFYTSSLSNINTQFGVIAENTTTNKRTFFLLANSSTLSLSCASYYQSVLSNFSINISDLKTLAAGSYKLYPAFKIVSTDYTDVIQVANGYARYVEMTITSSNINFKTPTVSQGNAVLTSLEPCTSMYVGKLFDSVAKLTCKDGDYSGNVTPVIMNGEGNIVYTGDSYNIDMEEGEEITKHIGFTAPSITPGNYFYYLVDDNDEMLGDEFTELTVKAAPTSTSASAKNLSFGNNNNVDADNMQLTATISCTAGFFGSSLYAYVFLPSGSSIGYIGPVNVFLEAGQSTQTTITGAMDLEPNVIYRIAIYYRSNNSMTQLSSPLSFTVGNFTGIQSAENAAEVSIYPNPATDRVNITTPEAISGIEVYSMAGNLVAKQTADGSNSATIDVENLATGIYMVKIATENATYVKRVIKR